MSDIYEFSITAEGQAFDADGTPLDTEGNRIEPTDPESSEDTEATKENS